LILSKVDCFTLSVCVFSQVVVSQAILPVNMLFSYLVLHTRYKWSHYLGALLILSGVLVAAHAALTATSTKAYWVIIQMSATIPASISNVVKEKGLKDLDLDVWYDTICIGFKHPTPALVNR